MDDQARKAQFWDRLLEIWGHHSPPVDDDFDPDDLWNLIQEYHRRPRLDGGWCPSCARLSGHPKEQCPNRPLVRKIEKL